MSKERFLNILKNVFHKIKVLFFQKDTLIFLIFLTIATFIWFLHTSNRRRAIKIPFTLEHKGIPSSILLSEDLPNKVEVKIEDVGNKIFEYAFSQQPTIIIDWSNLISHEKEVALFSKEQLEQEARRFIYSSSTITSMPNGIEMKYKWQGSKKVPVKLPSEPQLLPQQTLLDSISFSPDSVVAYGEVQLLDNLEVAYLEPIKQELTNGNNVLQLNIKTPKNLTFSEKVIEVTIPIELITEKTLEIPISKLNFPTNIVLHTFPSTVKVSFSVSVSNFKKVNTEDFSIVMDYNDLKNNVSKKQSIKVECKNPKVSNVSFYPREVEFLLEELK